MIGSLLLDLRPQALLQTMLASLVQVIGFKAIGNFTQPSQVAAEPVYFSIVVPAGFCDASYSNGNHLAASTYSTKFK